MTTTTHQRPWYAHEYPDRPLTAGAHLCCCIPCAVAIERCGHEDSRREVSVHTGLGVMRCQAGYLAHRRGDGQFHDMFHYTSGARINWINDIEVGSRRGRPSRREPDPELPFPRPLINWQICWHCGPLSNASFGDVTPAGNKRRPTRKELADYEQTRETRALLEACVLQAVRQQIERAEVEMAMHWARVDAGDYTFVDEDSRDDYGRPIGY